MNQTILITGASTGLGAALALEYAARGANLVLMARRAELLVQLTDQIHGINSKCRVIAVPSDVADYQAHQQHIRDAATQAGRIDVIIANAGVGHVTDELQNTFTETQRIHNTNVLGAIATLEAGKEVLLKQGFGQLVGVTSVAATRGLPLSSAYCSSKAALAVFLESMRIDLCKTQIGVTAIHPGFVATPMTEKNGYMPWLMPSQQAAKLIVTAILRRKARYTFPWQMRWITRLLRYLPNPIYDFIMKLSIKRAAAFKKKQISTKS